MREPCREPLPAGESPEATSLRNVYSQDAPPASLPPLPRQAHAAPGGRGPSTREESEEFSQALGQSLTGGFRLILWADRQGIPQALGLSIPEWTQQSLGGPIRLSIDERRKAVAELTEGEGLSNRQAADVLGV